MIADRVIAMIAGSVAVVGLLGTGVQSWRLDSEQKAHLHARLQHEEQLGKYMRAAITAQEEQDAKDTLVRRQIEQAREDGAARLAVANAAATVVGSERDKLQRAYAAAIAARSCPASGTTKDASGSTPADLSGDLLADVQRRLGESASDIAAFADKANAAAVTCWQAAQ